MLDNMDFLKIIILDRHFYIIVVYLSTPKSSSYSLFIHHCGNILRGNIYTLVNRSYRYIFLKNFADTNTCWVLERFVVHPPLLGSRCDKTNKQKNQQHWCHSASSNCRLQHMRRECCLTLARVDFYREIGFHRIVWCWYEQQEPRPGL